MDEATGIRIERRCLTILSGTAPSGEEFMDSPTFFLSRSPLRDRLWFLVFLEALIAIENRSVEYFEIDYIMAVNEYLVRRSDLSVRMLSTWIDGKRFRSMQEVTDFLNERYRTTCQFFRDNQLLCRREWKSSAPKYRVLWADAVEAQQNIPHQVRTYDEQMGSPAFRENPVAYLLSMREEERLRYIALIAMTIHEHEEKEGTGRSRQVKPCKDFVREFGNLLNVYIKYPEDPEVQPLTLMVHMDMNRIDFEDDRKRRAYFNDYLRMVAYLWHTNQNGCRASVVEHWPEYVQYFDNFPIDPDEPPIPALYLDEAVLNIPAFREDPLGFLHYQMHRSQCIHFLTMLYASQQAPENAVLSATVITNWIKDPASGASEEIDAYMGWTNHTQDERAQKLVETLDELVRIWRCDRKNCRRIVKRSWDAYESTYAQATGEDAIPEDLEAFDAILTDPAFVEDPITILRRMETGERADLADYCAALCGRDAHDAAVFADAFEAWVEDGGNASAISQMRRSAGYGAPALGGETEALREFFEKAAVSYKFNYGGFRSRAISERKAYCEEMERLMRDSLNTSFAQELRSYDEILSDEKFLKHPCEYLRGMSQSQCERFLMFLAASSGLVPESALQFAVRFKNILFYPNDGLRAKIDTMLGRISRDDKERYANIKELLLTAVPEASAQAEANSALSAKWGAYDALYKKRQAQIGKYHWELSEKNVERLYRFVRTGSEDASTVVAGDKGAVIVRILGDEKPMALRFKDVAVNADRLYSEQTGEILRYMLGQLEMFHLRGENRTQRTYPVTYPIGMISKKRGGYGEKIVWTDSETIVCELLYMAIGAELLPPLHQSVNERTGEVTLIIRLDEYGANKIETILQG